VEWADSLDGALGLVFGDEAAGDGDGDETPTDPPVEGTIEELIQQAEDAFARADTALRAGDLAGYQDWVDEAQRLLTEIADIVGSAEPDASASLVWD
jgi:hypothetical protein